MRRSVLLAVIVAMPLVAACGAPDAGPVGDVTDASPEVVASPEVTEVVATAAARSTDARDPEGHVFSINGQSDPNVQVDVLMDTYDVVVIGRVVESLPARWTTPDGLRPTDLYAEMPHPYTIATPYVVELELPDGLRSLPGAVIPLNGRAKELLGAMGDRIVIAANGGTVGKDSVVDSTESGLLTVGDELLIFASMHRLDDSQAPPQQLLPTESGMGWWASYRYVLGKDGFATINDRTMPTARLAEEILTALSYQ